MNVTTDQTNHGLKVMTYKFIQHIINENKQLQNDLSKY